MCTFSWENDTTASLRLSKGWGVHLGQTKTWTQLLGLESCCFWHLPPAPRFRFIHQYFMEQFLTFLPSQTLWCPGAKRAPPHSGDKACIILEDLIIYFCKNPQNQCLNVYFLCNSARKHMKKRLETI